MYVEMARLKLRKISKIPRTQNKYIPVH